MIALIQRIPLRVSLNGSSHDRFRLLDRPAKEKKAGKLQIWDTHFPPDSNLAPAQPRLCRFGYALWNVRITYP